MWTETQARRKADDESGYSSHEWSSRIATKAHLYIRRGLCSVDGGVCMKVVSEETACEGLSLGYLHINAK